jgi:hypothetical protein
MSFQGAAYDQVRRKRRHCKKHGYGMIDSEFALRGPRNDKPIHVIGRRLVNNDLSDTIAAEMEVS